MTDSAVVDLLVIGGGVNGAGIARDASGRGLKVMLCEKGDIAQGTSSRSGKLIHGGLRYLEYYEFRLVREALIEREVLLRNAPHIVWPMRFVLPHSPEQRPAWLVRLGLFLYDHLGGRQQLPGCRSIDLSRDSEGVIIKPQFRKAFEYSDCWVDDARLVLLNVLDAHRRGAIIHTRTAVIRATREKGVWTVELKSQSEKLQRVKARALVNAAGPWVQDVINGVVGSNSERSVRLVKGSHIILPKFWDGPQAYLFQNTDNRVIFVNPYEGNKALIGTTDIPFHGKAEDVAIDESETDYLLTAVNRYTRKQHSRSDVLSTFAGVRPLYDDKSANPSAVTRDYVFDLSGEPPVLSVFGGKITTYRKLSEHALQRLEPFFPGMSHSWTSKAPLPGGDIASFPVFLAELQKKYPFLPPQLAQHYARLYGTLSEQVLRGAKSLQDLGQHFGGQCYAAEIDYLKNQEWAQTPEDALFRRTKLGLHLTESERLAVAAHF